MEACRLKKSQRKREFEAFKEQISSSIKIEYNLAMTPSGIKANKKDLREYYYKILNMPVIPQYSPIQT